MALSKLLVASLVIFLVIFGVRSDSSISEPEPEEWVLRSELEALRSKVSDLESRIEDGTTQIKIKEDGIAKLESVIKEKSESIAHFKSEIESLKNKDVANVAKLSGNANVQVAELEKQILKLKKEIETQSKRRIALEARSSDAEKKVQELSLKLESLQKTNEEQKLRIKKTQRAVEVAEEELMRAQLEATSKLKELSEVHGAWLPTWLVIHITRIQELAETNWNKLAKPALIIALQKASETSEQVQKWAGPHLHAAKTKWVPAAKEQLEIFKTNAEPYWQKISARSIEVYEASWTAIELHVITVKELTDPYLKQAKEFSKPYINQVILSSKPHFEKLQILLMPYKEQVAHASGNFLKTARTYHSQVQTNIHEELKKHELTKPHATKELAWFMASALLAFPVFFLYRLLSANFCKKAKKPRQNAHASQKPRRPKRRHAEK